MNQASIPSFLARMGLSEREAAAYLLCLKLGPQTMAAIAKHLHITRPNVYELIKKLEEKGYVHTIGAAYGRKVQAHPPEELKRIVAAKITESARLEAELDDLLPLFRQATSSAASPFSTAENIKKMLWKSVHAKSRTIYSAGSELDIQKALGTTFLKEHHAYRASQGVHLLALRPGDTRLPGKEFHDDTAYLRTIRVRPPETVRLKSNMWIWDDFIAFFSIKDGQCLGILIENAALAMMLRSWFELIWEQSTPVA
jgi:sugar-specific transcriptional regulator TrmB